MTAIRWLAPGDDFESFPSPEKALDEPNGLLAAGGDLRPQRLLAAYRGGIFPWYERGQPILWWSPDPRAVLWPDAVRVSRSLRRKIAKGELRITADTAFPEVIQACAAPRSYGSATWITRDMAAAYIELHRLGWAHSFEAWRNDALVGGLYGVAIGHVFFGESMFSREDDASKTAFVNAIRYLKVRSFELVDCQVGSAHMTSLGATEVPRRRFLELLVSLCDAPRSLACWTSDHSQWNAS
jgi:leucyl/phenylalanyl-tRNA--protein transferase